MIFAPLLLAAILDMPSPCEILSRSELEKTLHWQVTGKRDSTYHLPQTSGSLCTYDAGVGTVLVTVPDHGSSFFQNNDLVDPFNNQLGLRVAGIGASAELFDNTAYLSKHGRSISIAVLPNDGSADAATLIALAKIAARRMP
jgi:hypothetical protein